MTVPVPITWPALYTRDPLRRRGPQNGQPARATTARALEQAAAFLGGTRRCPTPATLTSVEISTSPKTLYLSASLQPIVQRGRVWVVVSRSPNWVEGASTEVTLTAATDYGDSATRTWQQGGAETLVDFDLEVSAGTAPSMPAAADITITCEAGAGDVAMVRAYGVMWDPLLPPYGTGVFP